MNKKTVSLTLALPLLAAALTGCNGGSGRADGPAPAFGSKAGPRVNGQGGGGSTPPPAQPKAGRAAFGG